MAIIEGTFQSQVLMSTKHICHTVLNFVNSAGMGVCLIAKPVSRWTESCSLIQSAVCNLVRKNRLFGCEVSKQQMEEIQKIGVTLDDQMLVTRFTLLQNGTDERYARLSVHN